MLVLSIKYLAQETLLKPRTYLPSYLKRKEVKLKLLELWDKAYSPEIDTVLEPSRKKLGFAAIFRDLSIFDKFTDFISIAGKKKYGRSIIVDKLAFYVPYHVDIENYGIYFRIKNIETDFRKFAHFVYFGLVNNDFSFFRDDFPSRWIRFKSLKDNPKAFVVSLFIAYISFHYFHSLTHHIIEDISSYLEIIGKGKYSPISSLDEEKFANWAAFQALESYKVPEVLYQSKKAERLLNTFSFMLPPVNRDDLIDIIFAMPPLMYIHLLKSSGNFYNPEVTESIYRRFSIIWNCMKYQHFTLENDPVKLVSEKEIFDRVYLTKK